MLWHRIENNTVVESTDIDPAGRFHPSLIWVTDDGANAQVGWTYLAGVFAAPEPAQVNPEDIKTTITAKRWQVETGGLTLPTGVRVATGIDDQNRITSVIANAQLAGVQTVDFKAASGWVTVTVQELQAIAAAIAVHVQACFTAERAHHEAIDALAEQHEGEALQSALAAYDVQSGWPV